MVTGSMLSASRVTDHSASEFARHSARARRERRNGSDCRAETDDDLLCVFAMVL